MSPCISALLTFIMAMYKIHNAHSDNKKISTVEMLIHDSIPNIVDIDEPFDLIFYRDGFDYVEPLIVESSRIYHLIKGIVVCQFVIYVRIVVAKNSD